MQLGAGEIPVPAGGDNRQHPTEVSVPSEGNRLASHMPHSTMHRYGTETLSPATEHHHHHHLTDHHHNLANHLRQIEDHHQDPDDEDERVNIAAAMRGPIRAEYSLGSLFPNLTGAGASTGTGSNGGDGHHHSQHLEDVLHDDPYLQHQIRGSNVTGTSGGVSPTVRAGSSPGSSRSPHDDQGLSPHRHVQDDGYSPSDQGRLQSLTHLTTMQPPLSSVQNSQGLQDSGRVSAEHIYIDSMYATHPTGTTHHHHQEHDQGPSTPHSPGLARSVFFFIFFSLCVMIHFCLCD